MNEQAPNWAERFVVEMFARAISIGLVWFWVWILNPSIATNLVWLIAILFAETQVGFLYVRNELKYK